MSLDDSPDEHEWRAEAYANGMAIVTVRGPLYGGPYLVVSGLLPKDSATMADELAQLLNGQTERPNWLDDMERASATRVIGVDGTSVEAVGPAVPLATGDAMTWDQDEGQDAQDVRAALVDRLRIGAPRRRRKR
jgi:hypothetical protein